MRISILIAVAFCVYVAPAQAVVGGEKIDPADLPWFASVGGCGGTLVAPDRVLTASHCVYGRTPEDIGAAKIAMHPNWRHRNGENFLDDVAIVQLTAPITGVPAVTLGGTSSDNARIIGM